MLRLEKGWRSLVEGKGKPHHAFLRLASLSYGSVTTLRNALYDRHLLPTHSSPLPAISVGNILLGGSGKTPLVRFLAKTVKGKVAILSRGYKSKSEKHAYPALVLPGSSWEEVGDEPLMLARSLPDVLVIVSADRVKGALFAKELGADVLVLDDGFQHRRLARSCNIVCIPASVEPASLSLFPRGFLREPLSSLKRASLIAITECEDHIPPELERQIKRYTAAPLVGFTTKVKVVGADIQGKRVALFCGIARPERFRRSVEALGGEVVMEITVPDHGSPTAKEWADLKSADADLILCTEKDWVKGPPSEPYVQLDLQPLQHFQIDNF